MLPGRTTPTGIRRASLTPPPGLANAGSQRQDFCHDLARTWACGTCNSSSRPQTSAARRDGRRRGQPCSLVLRSGLAGDSDCIDDVRLRWRAGGTGCVLAVVKAPSPMATFYYSVAMRYR